MGTTDQIPFSVQVPRNNDFILERIFIIPKRSIRQCNLLQHNAYFCELKIITEFLFFANTQQWLYKSHVSHLSGWVAVRSRCARAVASHTRSLSVFFTFLSATSKALCCIASDVRMVLICYGAKEILIFFAFLTLLLERAHLEQ